ncbi:hypothetical protein [Actinoplanes sp. NPDC048796]|uniref:hypothetical protein n=1 Tax=unclassified Actinoplanes TaxID=2626549 RepID=UPI0033F07B5F
MLTGRKGGLPRYGNPVHRRHTVDRHGGRLGGLIGAGGSAAFGHHTLALAVPTVRRLAAGTDMPVAGG